MDEAGRGPVIGPLVISAFFISDEKENELKSLGVKDSKKLSRKKREEVYNRIVGIGTHKTAFITPSLLNTHMDRMSLNEIERKVMAELVRGFEGKVYVDLPDRNKKKFEEEFECEVVAEHKADEKYAVVSSASIIAKVERDRHIEKIKEMTGVDFGSGYPSDSKTRDAVRNRRILKFVRTKWKTYLNASQEKLDWEQ